MHTPKEYQYWVRTAANATTKGHLKICIAPAPASASLPAHALPGQLGLVHQVFEGIARLARSRGAGAGRIDPFWSLLGRLLGSKLQRGNRYSVCCMAERKMVHRQPAAGSNQEQRCFL